MKKDTTQAESHEDKSVSADGHETILKSKQTIKTARKQLQW